MKRFVHVAPPATLADYRQTYKMSEAGAKRIRAALAKMKKETLADIEIVRLLKVVAKHVNCCLAIARKKNREKITEAQLARVRKRYGV